MKICITGGAGYIGSILSDHLSSNGNQVTVIDNFRYNNRQIFYKCSDKNIEIIEGDVRDEKIQNTILKHDIIIPLAAIVGAPLCDKYFSEAYEVNYKSIKKLVDKKNNDQIVIYPTTNSGYGKTDGTTECTENSPLNPISHYGITKKNAEEVVLQYDNTVAFRLATVFGLSPRMRIDLLVNNFVFKALKDGCLTLFESHFIRNYIHVADVSNAFLFTINNFQNMKNDVYNIGLSNANLSKKELAYKIKKYLPNLAIVEEDFTKDKDQRNYIVSNQKIENKGYIPQISIDDGVKELIKGLGVLKYSELGNV